MSLSWNECPLITFNVTDSNSNLISGDVVVTVFDDYDEDISKYVFVFSGEGIDNFKDFDLKRLDEFDNGLDLLDIYNIVYSSMNSTKFNSSLIGAGLLDLYDGIDIDFPRLISDIIPLLDFNTSKIGDGLKIIASGIDINSSNLLYNLSDTVYVNKTAFNDALGIVLHEFNMTVDNVSNFIHNFTYYLNLTYSSEIEDELNNTFNGSEIIKLHDIIKVLGDIYKYNNLTIFNLAAALGKVTNGFVFNLSSVFYPILNPDSNSSSIMEGLSKLVKSFTINETEFLAI